MDNDRTIGLVNGIDECTPVPPDVYGLGLDYRYAIVLDTFRRDSTDMYFDAELYVALIGDIVAMFPQDSVSVTLRDGNSERTLSQALDHISAALEDDKEPLAEIRVFSGTIVSCLIITEYWTEVGGPDPYHDSYTISLYTATDLSTTIKATCTKVANSLGATINREGIGKYALARDVPTRVGLLGRIRRLFTVKF